jgi:hypothetical protein
MAIPTLASMTAAEFRRRHGGGIAKGEARPQIRMPKHPDPNKTEAAWMARCAVEFTAELYEIRYEPFTVRLPSGTRYTPDVVVFNKKTGAVVRVFEVKGKHIHSKSSLEKFKAAVAAFPFWRFGFAQLRGTQWAVEYAGGANS